MFMFLLRRSSIGNPNEESLFISGSYMNPDSSQPANLPLLLFIVDSKL